jgi:hypothetical protein
MKIMDCKVVEVTTTTPLDAALKRKVLQGEIFR